jgi:L-rhamnose mutarotase
VKRSGRDEPVWVVIHMCIQATLGISLYSYFYLKPAKTLFLLLSLMSSLQQNWKTKEWNRFCMDARVGVAGNGPNNVYAYK